MILAIKYAAFVRRVFLFRSDSSFREIPAILYLRSITQDISKYHSYLKTNSILSSADLGHNKV